MERLPIGRQHGANSLSVGPLDVRLTTLLQWRVVLVEHVNDREQGLSIRRYRFPKATGDECAFHPGAVHTGEMPLDEIWSGMSVELCANVDESLDGRDVDMVYAAEIEDNRLESRTVICLDDARIDMTRSGKIPGTIAESRVCLDVRSLGDFEDVRNEGVGVVVDVGVQDAFADTVDEDARGGRFDGDGRVGAICVVEGDVDVARIGVAVDAVDANTADEVAMCLCKSIEQETAGRSDGGAGKGRGQIGKKFGGLNGTY